MKGDLTEQNQTMIPSKSLLTTSLASSLITAPLAEPCNNQLNPIDQSIRNNYQVLGRVCYLYIYIYAGPLLPTRMEDRGTSTVMGKPSHWELPSAKFFT